MISSENKDNFEVIDEKPVLQENIDDFEVIDEKPVLQENINNCEVFNGITVTIFSSENKDNFEVITDENLYLCNIICSFNEVEDLDQLNNKVDLSIIENNKTENKKIKLNSNITIFDKLFKF